MAINEGHSPGLDFQYQRLPDASNHIRLLTAKFCGGNDSVTQDCELTTWHIDDSPAFSAVSYSWGDPAQTALLRVNGRPMHVTHNCEVALRQASFYSEKLSDHQRLNENDKLYYWCDAVCIDQQNQAEKEAQVASMGRIYRRAEHVLACLGAPVEGTDSPFLFRKIQSRSGMLRWIGEHWLPDGEFQLDIARLTDDKWTRTVTLFLLSLPRDSILRLCGALESLLGTPYFQRTWICQELFLGRKVILCCGVDCVPISDIYGLAQASTFLSSAWAIKPVDLAWGLLHPFTPKDQLRQFNCDRTRYFLWLLSAGSSPDPKTRSLGSLMWKIRYQECGDIRDKVYGTLSMVRWPDDETISVDYSRDTFDLAIQVMEVIRKRPGGWDGRWYDLAANVAQNLRLGSAPSEHLVQQVRKRSMHKTSTPDYSVALRLAKECLHPGDPEQHDVYWGYRLIKGDNEWALEGAVEPYSGLAEGRTTRIRSWLVDQRPEVGKVIPDHSTTDEVVLPQTAQPGDWCLLHSRGRHVFQLDSQLMAVNHCLSIDRVILIARVLCDDPQDRLSIIGKGCIYSDLSFTELEHPVATGFRVHLTDEDALVLAATSGIAGHLYDGLLATKGKKVGDSGEEEASGYFNTTVCTGIYSSFAVRAKQRSDDEW